MFKKQKWRTYSIFAVNFAETLVFSSSPLVTKMDNEKNYALRGLKFTVSFLFFLVVVDLHRFFLLLCSTGTIQTPRTSSAEADSTKSIRRSSTEYWIFKILMPRRVKRYGSTNKRLLKESRGSFRQFVIYSKCVKRQFQPI